MTTILYSLAVSLFDSVSTTQQIIIFTLLLTTEKPLRNALGYLAGLIGAYFFCGLAGYLAIDRLTVFLNRFFPSYSSLSNPVYYQSEFITGIIMIVIGVWYFYGKKHARKGRSENVLVKRLKSMNGYFAFGIGVFFLVTSFPLSVPYLIVLGKYTALHLGLPAVSGLVLVYNIGYSLPMLVILAVYLVARRGTDDFHDTLHNKIRILNVRLNTFTFVGLGLFTMIDAGSYFVFGRALIKGRFF
jgi:cytochrome c biogenesis protein CcdA